MAVGTRVMGTPVVNPLAAWTQHPQRTEVDFDGLAEVQDHLGRRHQQDRGLRWVGRLQLGVGTCWHRAANEQHDHA